ncbi:MAG: glutathione S-transferase family protein [Gammaproteobacteria bacterium]|nr:glutathione S-transferase family protein [Gammaproteobacteria bacterium]
MSSLTLVIGNRNYSSWSLRPWLVLKQAGIPFDEQYIPIRSEAWNHRIGDLSPSGKVPALIHGEVRVWDSLAICEYLAERFPEKKLWPDAVATRAEARSISAEMHSGFMALRQNMFMNIRRHMPTRGRTPETLADIRRIEDIWNSCRSRYASEGPFLFGRFSIADAMYAPVALRFQTYDFKLDGAAGDYAKTLLALPALQEWVAAARAEKEQLAHYEPLEA